jgi:hypothetical protein
VASFGETGHLSPSAKAGADHATDFEPLPSNTWTFAFGNAEQECDKCRIGPTKAQYWRGF